MSSSKIIILITCLAMVSNSLAGTTILPGVITSNTQEGLLSACDTTLSNIKIGLSTVTGLNALVVGLLSISLSLLLAPALTSLIISLTASAGGVTLLVVLLVKTVLSVLVEIIGLVIDLALGLLSQSEYNSKVTSWKNKCDSNFTSLTNNDKSGALALVLDLIKLVFGLCINITVIVKIL